jgi:hypothetical protein
MIWRKGSIQVAVSGSHDDLADVAQCCGTCMLLAAHVLAMSMQHVLGVTVQQLPRGRMEQV